MRHVQDGHGMLDLNSLQQVSHFVAGVFIKRGKRLIQEKHFGLHCERPPQRNPLTFPTRKPVGHAIEQFLKSQLSSQRAHGLLNLRFRPASDL